MGGFILGIIIIILIFAFGIIGVIVRLLKEVFMPDSRRQQNQNSPHYSQKSSSSSRKKIINKNEGEYVDFEEI